MKRAKSRFDMSQQDKILELLKDQEWVCSSQFYSRYIADPRKRLHELRVKGYEMEWRWCKTHEHQGQSKEWKLNNAPESFKQVKTSTVSDLIPNNGINYF